MNKLKALSDLMEDTQYKLQNDMDWLQELEKPPFDDPAKVRNLAYVNGLINARLEFIRELQYLID